MPCLAESSLDWLLDNQLVSQLCRKLQCHGPWASMEAAGSTQSMNNVCSMGTMCWCAKLTNMSQITSRWPGEAAAERSCEQLHVIIFACQANAFQHS